MTRVTNAQLMEAIQAQSVDIAVIKTRLGTLNGAVTTNTVACVAHNTRLAVMEEQQRGNKTNWGRAWGIINSVINMILTGVLVNERQ